jgi:hypothetical protein
MSIRPFVSNIPPAMPASDRSALGGLPSDGGDASEANAAPEIDPRAARFAGELEDAGNPLGAEIHRILTREPMIATESGVSLRVNRFSNFDQMLELYFAHSLRFPRMEALHRLLCGSCGPEQTRAVEKRPRGLAHVSAVFASMGSDVTLWKPDAVFFEIFKDSVRRLFPSEVANRLTRAERPSGLERTIRASIAYWINPEHGAAADGMDDEADDFRVIQSDVLRPSNFQPDPARWEQIYFATMEPSLGTDGIVFPTDTYYDVVNALIVHRRRTDRP